MSFPPCYWLIAVPTNENADNTRRQLTNAVGAYGQLHDFVLPTLKVGTRLDDLISLSDDLAKQDATMQGVVSKIERGYEEIIANKPSPPDKNKGGEEESKKKKKKKKDEDKPHAALKINNNLLPSEYTEKFRWSSRIPIPRSLATCVSDLSKEVRTADDDVKNHLQKFNDVRTTLEAIEKKESGTLLVRSLGEYVEEKDMTESAYLSTLLVVAPIDKSKQFETSYWKLEARDKENKAKLQAAKKAKEEEEGLEEKEEIPEDETKEEKEVREAVEKEKARQARLPQCDSIVPNTLKKLHADKEFALYKIVVLKKGPREMEYVKAVLRSEKFTVRPFLFDPEQQNKQKAEQHALAVQRYDRWKYLVQFLKTRFSDVFVNWMHLKAIRVFVEAVLRYGLEEGPNYQYCLVQPKKGSDTRVRKALGTLYAKLGSETGGEEEDEELLNSQFGEFYPYVSVTVDLCNEED